MSFDFSNTIQPMTTTATTHPKGYYTWPIIIALIFFVVFVVNGSMFYISIKNAPAVVNDDPWAKGLAYQKEIDQENRAGQLQWVTTFTITNDLVSPEKSAARYLKVHVTSPLGDVTGATVTVHSIRPSTPNLDTKITLKEEGRGIYSGDTTLVYGLWQFEITVKKGDESILIKEERTV